MKGKALIPLVLGLCIGLIAVKFGADAIKAAQAANAAKETVAAVQAVTDIRIGDAITEEMVQVVETAPNDFLPATERITKMEEVLGRVACKSVPAGAAVLQNMLATPGTSPGMVGRIPEGYRAFTVKANEVTSVAYQINPGDWVDVIVVMDVQNGRQKETIAEVILQNLEVAAVGRQVVAASPDEPGKTRTARSVTLLVPEKEVTKLHLAASRGKLTLALRGDDGVISSEILSSRDSDILASMKKEEEPEPTPEPAPPQHEGALDKLLQGMQFTMAARGIEEEPEPDPPHAVTVFVSTQGSPRIQRVTFENAHSRNILDLSDGPVARAASMMKEQKRQLPALQKPLTSQTNWGRRANSALPDMRTRDQEPGFAQFGD